jgi:hypothetical protein
MTSLQRTRLAAAVVWTLIGVSAGAAAEKPGNLARMSAAHGIDAGVCVHIGASDGTLEIKLAANGRRLVHGLALDDSSLLRARNAIKQKGLYPLASVEKLTTKGRLPYADNLVNPLVADLDVLGEAAPSYAEIMRVICPSGVASLKKDGKWSQTVKPRPKQMDDWTHFDYGPEGNAVSHDKLIAPADSPPVDIRRPANQAGWKSRGFRGFTDGLLSLPAGRGTRFSFDPHKNQAELKLQLETNPPIKKR